MQTSLWPIPFHYIVYSELYQIMALLNCFLYLRCLPASSSPTVMSDSVTLSSAVNFQSKLSFPLSVYLRLLISDLPGFSMESAFLAETCLDTKLCHPCCSQWSQISDLYFEDLAPLCSSARFHLNLPFPGLPTHDRYPSIYVHNPPQCPGEGSFV